MSRFREPFNGVSHLVGAWTALVGLAVLVTRTWYEPEKRISLAVFGASLTLMFAASTAYHSIHCSPERRLRLRKIDHAAIYALIAGTYTPLCINLFSGFWRWGMLALVWSIAVAGMVMKTARISPSDWAFIGTYLAMGWLCVFGTGEILRTLDAGALRWLLAGGALYTLGAVLVASKKLDFVPGVFGHHEVWHLFVGSAAFCHYMLMLLHVVPAPVR